jgi:hypothetical protein
MFKRSGLVKDPEPAPESIIPDPSLTASVSKTLAITMDYATVKTKLLKENEQRRLNMKISTYSIKMCFSMYTVREMPRKPNP